MDGDETERDVTTETTFGRITEIGFYGKNNDTPGMRINGAVYASSAKMSTYAGGLLCKPVMAETRGGWVVALRPVVVTEGDGLTDAPEGLRRVEAAAREAKRLIASAPRLSVRIEPSKVEGHVEFHVWDDATGQQMPDESPETYGVLMWLSETCGELFNEWITEQHRAVRGQSW